MGAGDVENMCILDRHLSTAPAARIKSRNSCERSWTWEYNTRLLAQYIHICMNRATFRLTTYRLALRHHWFARLQQSRPPASVLQYRRPSPSGQSTRPNVARQRRGSDRTSAPQKETLHRCHGHSVAFWPSACPSSHGCRAVR